MLWEKTTRLLDKKFGGMGREEIPLKSTVEMWAGSVCTCPGVPEGSNCCGDLPNISLDYLLSLSRSRTSVISGLITFFFVDSVLAHQNLMIFVLLFSRCKLDNKIFFLPFLFLTDHTYGCCNMAMFLHLALITFSYLSCLPTWLGILKLFLKSQVLFVPVRDLNLIL